MRANSSGFTFVELLVSVGLVGLLVMSVMGAFSIGHRSVKGLAEGLDANQQLRAALKMMTDDLNFARWDKIGLDHTDVHCDEGDVDNGNVHSCGFTVQGYQPTASLADAFWNDFDGWPGDLTNLSMIRIRYQLINGDLIREILDEGNLSRVYSSRVLVSGLEPYNYTETGSFFRSDSTGSVQVVLRMPLIVGGRTNVAQVSTILYIR